MDEISLTKQLASIFPKLYANQLRYSSRLGCWLCRDADGVWQPDEQQALQIARQFCHEAARYRRDRRLDTEATVDAVLRLASFEPAMCAPLPKDAVVFAVSAQRRVA